MAILWDILNHNKKGQKFTSFIDKEEWIDPGLSDPRWVSTCAAFGFFNYKAIKSAPYGASGHRSWTSEENPVLCVNTTDGCEAVEGSTVWERAGSEACPTWSHYTERNQSGGSAHAAETSRTPQPQGKVFWGTQCYSGSRLSLQTSPPRSSTVRTDAANEPQAFSSSWQPQYLFPQVAIL